MNSVPASIHTIQPDELDHVGKMMLSSASVFAAANRRIPTEYIDRLRAHKKTPVV